MSTSIGHENWVPDVPYPTLCVATLCINDAGQVLVILRSKPPRKGAWTLPGGRIEFGETASHAAIRELREETGLVANHCVPLGLHEHFGEGFHLAILMFDARVPSGAIHAGDDASEAAWLDLERLTEENSTYPLITSALSGRR